MFRFIKSEPARTAALLAGDVEMIDNVPLTDIATLKSNPNVSLSSGVSNRVIYIHMDQFRDQSPFVTDKDGNPLDKNPLKDARVRKALSMMIDRDEMVEKVMEGVALKAGQLLPEGFFARSPNLKPEPYDPEGAKKLLAEAGWGGGLGSPRYSLHAGWGTGTLARSTPKRSSRIHQILNFIRLIS